MRRLALAPIALLALAAVPAPIDAHGTCVHENVHTYTLSPLLYFRVEGERAAENPWGGRTLVWDGFPEDCDGDRLADFDGDLDTGVAGGAFGHGPWAEYCGFHVETGGSVRVWDLVFEDTVPFILASNDARGPLLDPETNEPTCLTDGVILADPDSPVNDEDDCATLPATGSQIIDCPGGGDGLLWVFLFTASGNVGTGGVQGENPATVGNIMTS